MSPGVVGSMGGLIAEVAEKRKNATIRNGGKGGGRFLVRKRLVTMREQREKERNTAHDSVPFLGEGGEEGEETVGRKVFWGDVDKTGNRKKSSKKKKQREEKKEEIGKKDRGGQKSKRRKGRRTLKQKKKQTERNR